MSHVNSWLLVLSFLLGLVLTLAFMIRRVKREVPIYDSAKFASTAGAKAKPESASATTEPKTEVISIPAAAAGTASLAGAAALAGSGTGSDDAKGEEPYGAGSFRLVGGASVPSGWTIKGNEDSMRYHTTDSPSYERTVAEIWFRDVPTAEAAGFNRWDSGKSQREKK